MNRKLKNKNPQSAFTIIELLVVIVIIGILATIVIIFYIGTHDKTIDGALQSDLKGASTVLELDKANGDLYPTTKESANDGKGLKSSSGTTLDYAYSSESNSYCLVATREGRSYHVDSSERIPKEGVFCIGSSFSKAWGGSGWDIARSITRTNDGGYAVTGNTSNFDSAYVAKYTADGTLSWNKTLNLSIDQYGSSITTAADGGIVVLGNASGTYESRYRRIFISKLSINGDLSWTKTIEDDYYVANSITKTSDGGYTITGFIDHPSMMNYTLLGGEYLFLAKITADGAVSWVKSGRGLPEYNTYFGQSVIQTSDGGFAVAGYVDNRYAEQWDDAFVAKFTPEGDLTWVKSWGGPENETEVSITQVSDGGIIATGVSNSYHTGQSGRGVFLFKLSSDGNLLWNKILNAASYEEAGSVTKTNDNGFALVSAFRDENSNAHATLLTKFENDGRLSWSRSWGDGFENDIASSIIQSSDGGYVMVGETNSFVEEGGGALLIKYTANGLIEGCPSWLCRNINLSPSNQDATIISLTLNMVNTVAETTGIAFSVSNLTTKTKNITPYTPLPPMTVIFSAQELYVAYPGESQTVCKEWTVPNGKTIKAFQVSQASESGYDYFTVSLDGVEKYNKSGTTTDRYVDTSSTPGTTLKACMSADSSYQGGYGGEVTGVIYN